DDLRRHRRTVLEAQDRVAHPVEARLALRVELRLLEDGAADALDEIALHLVPGAVQVHGETRDLCGVGPLDQDLPRLDVHLDVDDGPCLRTAEAAEPDSAPGADGAALLD